MRARGSVEPQEEATQNTNEERTAPLQESRLAEPAPEAAAAREVTRGALGTDAAEAASTLSDEAGTPAVGSAPTPLEVDLIPPAAEQVTAPVAEDTQPHADATAGLSALALVGFLSFYRETHKPSRKERKEEDCAI